MRLKPVRKEFKLSKYEVTSVWFVVIKKTHTHIERETQLKPTSRWLCLVWLPRYQTMWGHNRNASSEHYLSESEVGSGIEIGVNWQTHSRSPTHTHTRTHLYIYIYHGSMHATVCPSVSHSTRDRMEQNEDGNVKMGTSLAEL